MNVKPVTRLADPAVAEALAWPGPLFEACGWDHEIWTGPPDDVASAVPPW